MITVACVFVRGHVPFTVEYVTRLRAMVARHLARPHRFVCLTDQPQAMPPGVEPIWIPSPGALKGWWSKVRLFDPAIGLSGRVLYLDLDTLVVGDLDEVVAFPSSLALVPDGAPDFRPKDGRAVVKLFNSSVMVWDAGTCAELFTEWTPKLTETFHGDQDWIGARRPDGALMPPSWFPRLSAIAEDGPPPGARVILVKSPKNVEAARRWPWVDAIWRAA